MKNFAGRRLARARRAFTLIELLVVISVIGVLAAFTLTVVGGVQKKKYINNATAEMGVIQAALERYKAAYGFYPPSNPNLFLTPVGPGNVNLISPLYFELQGVTAGVLNGYTNYTTLDGLSSINAQYINTVFGVSGIVNCSKGAGEDAVVARNFLPNLKANQIGFVDTQVVNNVKGVGILISSVGGPDQAYQPLGIPSYNPWRYNSINPTNNPGSYDLYLQLQISGKKYLICNWSKQNPVNSPLP